MTALLDPPYEQRALYQQAIAAISHAQEQSRT